MYTNVCIKKKAGSSDAGLQTRNCQTASEGKEIVETVTLRHCKDNVEDDDGITDVPPMPSHSEAYSLINQLTMAGGARQLRSLFSAVSL